MAADAVASVAGATDLTANRGTPKISVVMAAYNAASTLDRAIRSLVAQSERSWELIIVDDGSKDETPLRASTWASRNKRIRVISQSNMGASQARNRGLYEARGDWIVFFDADDTMDRRHFAMMLKAIRSSPDAGAAACGWARVDTKGRRAFSIVPPKDRFSFEAIYTFGPPTVIHAYLLPRRLLLTEGGFDVRFKTGEDWDLWIRLARMGLRFAVVPKVLALYWDSGGSLTKDAERLLRDDIAIRQLARGPDARISTPLPEYANGIQRDNPAQDSLFSALYWGATLLGAGQSPRYLLDLIRPFRPLPPPEDLAGVLRAGLEMVAPGGPPGIIAHWPSLAESVLDFLQAFECWSQTPGLATAILDEVELECLRKGRFRGAVRLTHSIGLNLFSLASWRGITSVPPSIDRVTVKVGFRDRGRIVAKIPLFGPMSGRQIQIAVARRLLRHVERRALGTDSFGRWVRRVGRLMPLVNRMINALGLPRSGTQTLPAPLGRIVDQESDRVAAWKQPLAPPPVIPTTHPDEESANGWDRFYEQEDPWDYGNAYEQQKYDDTIELIPLVDGEALEIACSEGRFTEKLAAKSERILAVDISANALARAARRCARFPDVKFKQMDVFHEELTGSWALIVCSEMLYYLPDKPSLVALIERLFAAVRPAGYFVHAHARSIDDDTTRSGFDWGRPFGADFIAESLTKAGFVRRRTTDRDIYRIDLFQKPPIPAPAVEPTTTRREIECVLPDSVAGGVVWRGAIQTRSRVESKLQTRLPVLAYHRIAENGPDRLAPYRLSARRFEEQLIFLRRRGYRSCSPMDTAAAARRSGVMRGRPIMITFDDGYADFYESAWPILQRNGFSAHNFIVTERVGGHADWDAQWGPPAPLMNWDQIARLSAQGATFGSHLATHTAATHLRPAALFREAVSSRLKLEKVLGTPIDTVATPFGESNGLVELVLQQAGYRQHFGNHLECLAPISSNWLLIPRLFVTSDLDIKAFGNMIHMAYEPPEAADRPLGATAEMDCQR